MNQNLTGLTLLETVKGLEKRSFSLEDLNKAYQVRIAEIDKHSLLSNSKLLNCYITVNSDSNGIPAGIKDVF